MILIITEDSDLSTFKVIDWLDHYGIDWFRVNTGEILGVLLELGSDGTSRREIETSHGKVNLDQIKGIWFRRGQLTYEIDEAIFPNNHDVKNHINYEWETIRDLINRNLDTLSCIGNIQIADNLNKLELLQKAVLFGLNIPRTIVTGHKMELLEFKKQFDKIITKGVQRNPSFTIGDKAYFSPTKEITEDLLEKSPDKFFPSLFQELIVKQYEVRVFYLMGKCYSMAKFPNSYETTIDIRNNKRDHPLRAVPFDLPEEIKDRLNQLMDSINLNCGSIDLVVDKNDKFYFLEINAIGQYDDVSSRCNYGLDKKIAERLISSV